VNSNEIFYSDHGNINVEEEIAKLTGIRLQKDS
jgi:hypothetical protein